MISLRLISPTASSNEDRDGEASSAMASPADAVEQCFAEHHDFVFRLAMRYGAGDRAWAEDVAQDVFIALLHTLEHGAPIQEIRAWLYRTTTNRCLTCLRRDRFLELPAVSLVLGMRMHRPATPEDLGIVDDGLRLVHRVLGRCSGKERVCFYMYHVDNLTMEAIAQALGHTKGYVSKLLSRVEQRMRIAEAKGRQTRHV